MMKNLIDNHKFFLTVLFAILLAFSAGSSAGEMQNRTMSLPAEGEDPTQVHFFVFMLNIDDIDEADQSFTVNVYVRLRWKDERLTHNGTSARTFPLEDVWNPQIIIVNEEGTIRKSLPQNVTVAQDGTVRYDQRYIGALSQPLKLSDFPRDRHQFTIQFAAAGHTAEKLIFVPDVARSKEKMTGGGISRELSLPDWKIVKYEALVHPYEPVPEIRGAGFAFQFEAKRYWIYYFWQMIVPLAVIVAMSWAAFWIDPSLAAPQIGVATSSILSLVAYRFVLGSLLPRLPYMTRMDYFMLGSTVLVFMALVEVILTSALAYGERSELARRMDRLSRFAFPAIFLLVFIWSMFGG
ncbi:hypothetical protein ACFL9T_20645 [Thermodesulfobacteriota bacterium]